MSGECVTPKTNGPMCSSRETETRLCRSSMSHPKLRYVTHKRLDRCPVSPAGRGRGLPHLEQVTASASF